MRKTFKLKFFFLIFVALIFGISAVLAYSYFAQDVGFTPTDSEWEVEDVKEALDDLRGLTNCDASFVGMVWRFTYYGQDDQFVVPCRGDYKIEVWGAQGGYTNSSIPGGYGAYAVGIASLKVRDVLYINIGGKGLSLPVISTSTNVSGGYNGGGRGCADAAYSASGGGGATHIARIKGKLEELSAYKDTYDTNVSKDIFIVAAGGGGAYYSNTSNYGTAGAGGGIIGVNGISHPQYASYGQALPGSQTEPGTPKYITSYFENNAGFGRGGDLLTCSGSGGGSGWYGGGANHGGAGAGGSSYIASHLLIPNTTNDVHNKMYCYNCTESSVLTTYTIASYGTTTHGSERNSACSNGYSSDPISGCAKAGDGYAQITYLG